jgi:hypothetical protein
MTDSYRAKNEPCQTRLVVVPDLLSPCAHDIFDSQVILCFFQFEVDLERELYSPGGGGGGFLFSDCSYPRLLHKLTYWICFQNVVS